MRTATMVSGRECENCCTQLPPSAPRCHDRTVPSAPPDTRTSGPANASAVTFFEWPASVAEMTPVSASSSWIVWSAPPAAAPASGHVVRRAGVPRTLAVRGAATHPMQCAATGMVRSAEERISRDTGPLCTLRRVSRQAAEAGPQGLRSAPRPHSSSSAAAPLRRAETLAGRCAFQGFQHTGFGTRLACNQFSTGRGYWSEISAVEGGGGHTGGDDLGLLLGAAGRLQRDREHPRLGGAVQGLRGGLRERVEVGGGGEAGQVGVAVPPLRRQLLPLRLHVLEVLGCEAALADVWPRLYPPRRVGDVACGQHSVWQVQHVAAERVVLMVQLQGGCAEVGRADGPRRCDVNGQRSLCVGALPGGVSWVPAHEKAPEDGALRASEQTRVGVRQRGAITGGAGV